MTLFADPPVTAPFAAFGRQHILTLLTILGLSFCLPLWINRLRSPRASTLAASILGTALLAAKAAELIWYAAEGVGWRNLLPLQLCDLAAFAAAATLFSRNRFVFELAYFWGMGGTLQALLTPDLSSGFPSADFWFFFVPHGLVIAGIFFATASLGLRPRPGSVLRVIIVTLIISIPVGATDWLLGKDYMYLCRKPDTASLFDYLGPWPWYVLALLPLSAVLLSLWYSPFWIYDRRRERRDRRGSKP